MCSSRKKQRPKVSNTELKQPKQIDPKKVKETPKFDFCVNTKVQEKLRTYDLCQIEPRDSMVTCFTVESDEIDEKVAIPSKRSPSKRISLDNEERKRGDSPQRCLNHRTKQQMSMKNLASFKGSGHQKTFSEQQQKKSVNNLEAVQIEAEVPPIQSIQQYQNQPNRISKITTPTKRLCSPTQNKPYSKHLDVEIDMRLEESERNSPDRKDVTNSYKDLIQISVEQVQEVISKKKQAEKLNQQLRKQLRYLEEENNNLFTVNKTLTDKIDSMTQKQVETSELIEKLRPRIIEVNQKRLDTRDILQSEINDREAGGVEIKLILEKIKIANAEEAQKEQEELNDQRNRMRNLRIDIEEAKERLDDFKDKIRKFRLAESERMKKVVNGQKQLKIFIKQNQKSHHIDFIDDDEETKEKRTQKMQKSFAKVQSTNKSYL